MRPSEPRVLGPLDLDVRHKIMNEFKRPDREPDLEVVLKLHPTNQGGRKHPLWQGCRLPHDFGLQDEINDGMYEFPSGPPAPGECKRGNIWLLAPERNQCRLHPGFVFRIWKGRFIGEGEIVSVINPELRKAEPSAGENASRPTA